LATRTGISLKIAKDAISSHIARRRLDNLVFCFGFAVLFFLSFLVFFFFWNTNINYLGRKAERHFSAWHYTWSKNDSERLFQRFAAKPTEWRRRAPPDRHRRGLQADERLFRGEGDEVCERNEATEYASVSREAQIGSVEKEVCYSFIAILTGML
jgi:hypothetical protein